MRVHKKIFVLGISILTLLVLLAACSSGGSGLTGSAGAGSGGCMWDSNLDDYVCDAGCYWDSPRGQAVCDTGTGEECTWNANTDIVECPPGCVLGEDGESTVCDGSGGGGVASTEEAWNPYVDPLIDHELIPYMDEIPNDDGQYACGYFDPATTSSHIGWGPKAAYIQEWPDCASYLPDLTIMCLGTDDAGNRIWRSNTVVNLTYTSSSQTFEWESQQDGFCGFFPTN